MKKTNTQFALVFVAVLVLHLGAATLLMNSAETEDDSEGAVALLTPAHRSDSTRPDSVPRRGPAEDSTETASASGQNDPNPSPGNPPETLADAFANSKTSSPATPEQPGSTEKIPQPDIPGITRKPAKPGEPAPETNSPTRRLTVSELLATEGLPRVKPDDESSDDPPRTGAADTAPKIKPLPPVEAKTTTGPRKIRSLPGN